MTPVPSPPEPAAAGGRVAPQDDTPTALEFFSGGGMARLGLEAAGFRCVFANDIDPAKCAAYRANFGEDGLLEGDVAALEPDDLPAVRADLAWASFPCQDLSLAGGRSGMEHAEIKGVAGRSSAFWPFWFLMQRLDRLGRGPRAIVIENVLGLASSRGGADFLALAEAIALSGRRFSALMIDGALFVPQSRPRLFIIAWPAWRSGESGLEAPTPSPAWTPPPLARALGRLSGVAAVAHRPLAPPPPETPPPRLETVLEDAPSDVPWLSPQEVSGLLAMMTPTHRDRVEAARARARATATAQAGGLYRRMREDGQGGRAQRAEVRFDRAGCLRTPAGGSSRQTLLIAAPDGGLSARLISAREAARLMGIPESYRLPSGYTEAYRLVGDGVVVDAARFVASAVVRPLLDAVDRASATAEIGARQGPH